MQPKARPSATTLAHSVALNAACTVVKSAASTNTVTVTPSDAAAAEQPAGGTDTNSSTPGLPSAVEYEYQDNPAADADKVSRVLATKATSSTGPREGRNRTK
uniref:Uncharacterized protein n=1 Tax=Anopheles melas TaxID=34690 RepID=A0A182U8X3_9DIPT